MDASIVNPRDPIDVQHRKLLSIAQALMNRVVATHRRICSREHGSPAETNVRRDATAGPSASVA